MQRNVGKFDAVLRMYAAAALIVLALILDAPLLRAGCLVAGILLAASAVTGFCFLYKLAGKSSCPIKSQDEKPEADKSQAE